MFKNIYLILSLLFLVSASFANSDLCVYYYRTGSLNTPWHLDFENELKNNKGSLSIMVLDAFLEKRIGPQLGLYGKVTEFLGRQGVDSKLQSQLKIFDKYFNSAQKSLTALNEKLNATDSPKKKKFPSMNLFNKSKQAEPTVEESIESFKSCKLGLETCVDNLQLALKDSESILKTAEVLQVDLVLVRDRTQELSDQLQNHPDSTFFNSLFTQRLTALDSMQQILKTVSTLEKQKLVMSLLNLRDSYPNFKEQFELMIAEHAGNEHISGTNWSAKKNGDDKSANLSSGSTFRKTYFGLKKIQEKIYFLKNYAATVASKNVDRISVEDALKVLESLDDTAISTEEYLKMVDVRNYEARSYNINSKPMIAIYLAQITEPSKDISLNMYFLSKLNAVGVMSVDHMRSLKAAAYNESKAETSLTKLLDDQMARFRK